MRKITHENNKTHVVYFADDYKYYTECVCATSQADVYCASDEKEEVEVAIGGDCGFRERHNYESVVVLSATGTED